MKIKTIVKTVPTLRYEKCEVGEVYSQTSKIGMRESTNYYLRTQVGMVNLETGTFIPDAAYTTFNGLHRGLSFVHVPDAEFTV